MTDNDGFRLTSSDTSLVNIFNFAQKTSMGYVGNDIDPVGPWYEAALPGREAFCIRDVSHQCIDAEILWQGKQNLNMFRKFVENISEEKDYCSYWEINRYNKPAPDDYVSDQDFWYNMNANFGITDACYKLYKCTGDNTYHTDSVFDRFFKLTLNQFVERWQLQCEQIMDRPAFMNLKPTTIKYSYARGIPSYDEQQDDTSVSGDLIEVAYNGFSTYAKTLKELIAETLKTSPNERFVWVFPDRVMEVILNYKQSPERRLRIEKAICPGRIVLHALPYTFESDVPSHSWILPSLLANAEVRFVHIRVNPWCPNPKLPNLLTSAYEQDGLYTEHTWGIAGPAFGTPDHKTWVKNFASGKYKDQLATFNWHAEYANKAMKLIKDGLSTQLANRRKAIHYNGLRIVIFNSLSWARDWVVSVEIPKDETLTVSVGDFENGKEIPGARLGRNIKFTVAGIPAGGYPTYSCISGKTVPVKSIRAETLETAYFKVKFDTKRGVSNQSSVKRIVGN